MPKFLASHPTFAPILTEATASDAPVFAPAVRLANLVNISIAEQWQQLSPLAGGVSLFGGATITLSTTGISATAAAAAFGSVVDGNHLIDPEIAGKMGSLFFCEAEFFTEGLLYSLTWIRRCILMPPAEANVAKGGGSVTLTNPSMTGRAFKDASGRWRERFYFESAEAVLAALRERTGQGT